MTNSELIKVLMAVLFSKASKEMERKLVPSIILPLINSLLILLRN